MQKILILISLLVYQFAIGSTEIHCTGKNSTIKDKVVVRTVTAKYHVEFTQPCTKCLANADLPAKTELIVQDAETGNDYMTTTKAVLTAEPGEILARYKQTSEFLDEKGVTTQTSVTYVLATFYDGMLSVDEIPEAKIYVQCKKSVSTEEFH